MPKTQAKNEGTIHMTSGNRISLPPGSFPQGVRDFRFEIQKDGSILLIPLCMIPASQRYFWTPRWQEGERAADEAARTGKVFHAKDAEDLIDQLNRRRKKRDI